MTRDLHRHSAFPPQTRQLKVTEVDRILSTNGERARGAQALSTVDLLEQATGEDAGPELARAVQLLGDEQVEALVEQVLAEPIRPRVTPRENEVWPLISARTSTFTAGGSNPGFVDAAGAGGINLFAAVDPRFSGTGRFSNSLLRALLYSHGLVIEDPLAIAADMYVGTSSELRPLARTMVEAAVESLAEIAPLLQGGVIETFFGRTSADATRDTTRRITDEVTRTDAQFDLETIWESFESDYVSQLHPGLQSVWREVRAGNRSPSMDGVQAALAAGDVEVVEVFVEVVSQLRPRAVIDNAIDAVAETLADAHTLDGKYDLLCPTPLFAQLLFVGDPNPIQALHVRELARVEIPTLANLQLDDVIAIRRASEAFSLWRTRLSLGLERAHRLREDVGAPIDAHAAVAEVMADARSSLFREFETTASLRSRLAQPVNFVAGALAGAIGGATAGPSGAAIGAAAATLPPLLARIVRGKEDFPGFLRRHYLLFESQATPQR